MGKNLLKLCTICCKDQLLKHMVKRNSNGSGKCTFCGCKRQAVVEIPTNQTILNVIRALIKYHYSFYAYSGKRNRPYDPNVSKLLKKKNVILNEKAIEYMLKHTSAVLSTTFFSALEKPEKPHEGVSLLPQYLQYGRRPKFIINTEPIRERQSQYLNEIQGLIEKENYFTFEDRCSSYLGDLALLISRKILSGTVFYRSRIGHIGRWTKFYPADASSQVVYRPYQREKISAPSPIISLGGRMNRPGVSFLYLAEDEKTAIAEIRPHTGERVSVGAFEARRDLKVADLTQLEFKFFCLTDKQIDNFVFLKNVNKEFSMPVAPAPVQRYSTTQFLSEIFRRIEFEGIIYDSSLTGMKNLVVFNHKDFKYCDDSGKVFLVDKVQYTCSVEKHETKPDRDSECYYFRS